MSDWSHIALVIAAYLAGGLSPGYWLAKKHSGVDLRATGSGATGASNAGRVLGKRGFYIVVLLDILKGLLAALAARIVMPDLSHAWQCAVSYAVVAGHIWPVWLGFRGGKGVATFYGAWSLLGNAQALIPAAVCLLLVLALKKPVFRGSFSIAWLALHALFPAILWWLWRDFAATALCATTILSLWFAHRDNIAAAFGNWRPEASGQKTAEREQKTVNDEKWNARRGGLGARNKVVEAGNRDQGRKE